MDCKALIPACYDKVVAIEPFFVSFISDSSLCKNWEDMAILNNISGIYTQVENMYELLGMVFWR